MTAKAKKSDFEASLAELEALVARMESGEMPLDEALKGFERGVQLTRECQAALQVAQLRVQQLVERPEGATPVDFEPAGDDVPPGR